MKTWKEVKLYVADGEQTVAIEPNETQTGVCLLVTEVLEESQNFRVYLTYQEAKDLGKELIKYAEENEQF